MKVEFRLFVVIGVFFAVVGLIYGTFTHWHEAVGPFGLFLCAGVAALIGFYLWETGRKLDPRPEDDPSALISAAEGEYGFLSLIHISEPTRRTPISYAVFCLQKKNK